jgi:hypothetical protein
MCGILILVHVEISMATGVPNLVRGVENYSAVTEQGLHNSYYGRLPTEHIMNLIRVLLIFTVCFCKMTV